MRGNRATMGNSAMIIKRKTIIRFVFGDTLICK